MLHGIHCHFVLMQPGGGDLNPNCDFNLRAELWRIITDLDSLKKKCVEDFNRKLK